MCEMTWNHGILVPVPDSLHGSIPGVRMSLLMGLMALSGLSSGVSNVGDRWRCDELARVVEELWEHYFDHMSPGNPLAYQLEVVQHQTGLALNTTEGRQEFACKIADADSLSNLSSSLGVPYLRVYSHYRYLERSLQEAGGLDAYYYFLTGLNLFLHRFHAWAEDTGFPEMPLNARKSQVMEFFAGLFSDFGPRVFQHMRHDMPFLTDISMETIVHALTESASERELVSRLQTSPSALHFPLDTYMQTSSTGIAYRALRVAVHTGLLPIPYTDDPYVSLRADRNNTTPACLEVLDLAADALSASQDPLLGLMPGVMYLSAVMNTDLLDQDQLYDFACAISECRSLEDVATVTNISLVDLESNRDYLEIEIEESYGGYKGIANNIQAFEMMINFAKATDFPYFPLEGVTHDLVRSFLSNLYYDVPDASSTLSYAFYSVLPLDMMSLDELADILVDSASYEQYHDAAFLQQSKLAAPHQSAIQDLVQHEMPAMLRTYTLSLAALDWATHHGLIAV